jgi:hypothetical protein
MRFLTATLISLAIALLVVAGAGASSGPLLAVGYDSPA